MGTCRYMFTAVGLLLAATSGASKEQEVQPLANAGDIGRVDATAIAEAHAKKEDSPYVGREFPTRVLFCEAHLHTAVSVDAGTMCTVGQENAFRFARGEEITTTHGLKARLSRPLDFMVLTDHAEMYGLMPALLKGDPDLLKSDRHCEYCVAGSRP